MPGQNPYEAARARILARRSQTTQPRRSWWDTIGDVGEAAKEWGVGALESTPPGQLWKAIREGAYTNPLEAARRQAEEARSFWSTARQHPIGTAGEFVGWPSAEIREGNIPGAVTKGALNAATMLAGGLGARRMTKPPTPRPVPKQLPAMAGPSAYGSTGRFVAGELGLVDAASVPPLDVQAVSPRITTGKYPLGHQGTTLPREVNAMHPTDPVTRATYTGTGGPAPLRDLRSSAGIDPFASYQSRAFEALVPERYKSQSNIQPWEGSVVEQPRPAFYPPEDPRPVRSMLPDVDQLGSFVEPGPPMLPEGIQSKLRKAGIPPENIASMTLEQAGSVLKTLQPKVKPKMARQEIGGRLQREFPGNEAVKATVQQARSKRPYEQVREVDLKTLAKMGDKKAIEELDIRARAMGGIEPSVLGDVDAPKADTSPFSKRSEWRAERAKLLADPNYKGRIEYWKQEMKNQGFPEDEINRASRSAERQGIDASRSDDLYDLGEYMKGWDPFGNRTGESTFGKFDIAKPKADTPGVSITPGIGKGRPKGNFPRTAAIDPKVGRESARLMGGLIDEPIIKSVWEEGRKRYPGLTSQIRELEIEPINTERRGAQGAMGSEIVKRGGHSRSEVPPEDFRTSKIYLTENDQYGRPRTESAVYGTLGHELLHAGDQLRIGDKFNHDYWAASKAAGGSLKNPYEIRARAAGTSAMDKVFSPNATRASRLRGRGAPIEEPIGEPGVRPIERSTEVPVRTKEGTLWDIEDLRGEFDVDKMKRRVKNFHGRTGELGPDLDKTTEILNRLNRKYQELGDVESPTLPPRAEGGRVLGKSGWKLKEDSTPFGAGGRRYVEVKLENGKRVRLRVDKESDKFLQGIEVDKYGDEIVPRGKDPEGRAFTERRHIIQKDLVKGTEDLEFNKTYGWLEKLKKKLGDESGAVLLERGEPKPSTVDYDKPIGGPKGTYFHRKVNPEFDRKFENWVNERRATKVEGIIKRREFKDLDERGFDGITQFQAGLKGGRFKDVASYFDTKHKELTETGVKLGFRENYLPQLWENSADEIFQVAKRLGLKPQFTLERVLENYQAGINAGLKPKYKNIGELIGWYEERANKAIADRKFFDHLRETRQILPEGKAPQEWTTLNPDNFPVQKFKTRKGEHVTKLYKAPKPIAEAINNYLGEGTPWLKYVADKASLTKNIVLSSGVPKTGINAHGFNILARNVMARGARGGVEGVKYLINPKSARDWFDAHIGDAPDAVKHGLSLTTEEHFIGQTGSTHLLKEPSTKVGKVLNRGFNKVLETHGKFFEDPLFQNILPALKLKYYKGLMEDFAKEGMTPEAAKRAAADTTNALYGGINWEGMQRSRDLQNMMRSIILAPDWFESQYRVGKGMAKTIQDKGRSPRGLPWKRASANLIAAYAAANAVNYAINGQPMWENEPGHALDIKAGKIGGKTRWIRPFGTAADFARLPFDTIAGAMQGDLSASVKILKNRRSTVGRLAGNIAMNVDDFGSPILGRDKFGREQPIKRQLGNLGREVSEAITPQYVGGPIDYATGRAGSVEEAALGSVEAPVRYSRASTKKRSRYRPVRQRPSRTR